MNNILLIGNGFDIAHGLQTRYGDFLELIKNWKFLWECYQKNCPMPKTDIIDKFLVDRDGMDKDNLIELHRIIRQNSWIKYFEKCEAEVDGWIDFEKEIIPVIDFFDFLFHCDVTVEQPNKSIIIPKQQFTRSQLVRIASLWDNFVTCGSDTIHIKSKYISGQYGILKKKMMKELRREFEEFIRAFEIYLLEFVHKSEKITRIKQIEEIEITSVVSFNYTLTEQRYGISEENVHHIHGMIRTEKDSDRLNNMVMGINEQPDQKMDFIYFVKYFQRLQKGSGTHYKDIIKIRTFDKKTSIKSDEYTLYIYGHSLDETDEDILKYLIGDLDTNNLKKTKPEQVVIFYYDADDYEQKLINLIKLYGRETVETKMEKQYFEFRQIIEE